MSVARTSLVAALFLLASCDASGPGTPPTSPSPTASATATPGSPMGTPAPTASPGASASPTSAPTGTPDVPPPTATPGSSAGGSSTPTPAPTGTPATPEPTATPTPEPTATATPAAPLAAEIKIYNPMTPFGPQQVTIAAGGTITFTNVNSGKPWEIQWVSGPSTPNVPIPTSYSSGTITLTQPGTYEYQIYDPVTPSQSFVVHGFITVI